MLKTNNCRDFWGSTSSKPRTVVIFGVWGIQNLKLSLLLEVWEFVLFFSPPGDRSSWDFFGLFSLNLGRSRCSKHTIAPWGFLPPQNLELSSFLGSDVSKTWNVCYFLGSGICLCLLTPLFLGRSSRLFFSPIWAGRGAQNPELSSLLGFYLLET